MVAMALGLELLAASIPWDPVDDVVMGGRSASTARVTAEQTVLFTGKVSLENNGGFASIKSAEGRFDLGPGAGLCLRVRGDGKRYKLNLATYGGFDGLRYQAPFETAAAQWQDVAIPFSAFEPRFRGRLVPDAPPLDPSRVASFGFVIADRQAGPFQLEIARLWTLPAGDEPGRCAPP